MTLITANYRLLKIIGLGFVVLLLVPLLIHHYLTLFTSDTTPSSTLDLDSSQPSFIIQLQNIDKLDGADLKYRIEELHRIKQSVSLELHTLEAKRRQIQLDITQYTKKLEEFKSDAAHKRNELDRLQISLEQAKVAEREAMERSTPRLLRPRALGALKYREFLSSPAASSVRCEMETCFDYSLCPISNPFTVYLYPMAANESSSILHKAISSNQYTTSNPYKACLFIAILDSCTDFKSLNSLLFWNGDGRNHLIWPTCSVQVNQDIGRAMVVTPPGTTLRPSFDVQISHLPSSITRITHTQEVLQLPPIAPAKRKYLASYLGPPSESNLQSELLRIQQEDPVSFVFQFSCSSSSGSGQEVEEGAANKKLSDLCNNDLLRTRLLVDSTFSLLLLPPGEAPPSDLQLRLYESLKYGAIPVLIGSVVLPFSEVIDWGRAVLQLPSSRITELHYILKYISDPDLLAMRKNGRSLYENYMSSIPAIVETTLAILRTRLALPSAPFKDVHLHSVFNESFVPLKLESITLDPEDEENLGPIEPPYTSPSFTRNFSISNLDKYKAWNSHLTLFNSYPTTPWDGVIPSEAKFRGSSLGFRPINSGQGGAGKEFSESLGGNLPKEQFTIIMLTYEREQVLINSLSRLYLVPYLNKVIVVWNSENPPTSDLKWPDIGVPIIVLKSNKNSLNNRFLPFAEIETEAILSIDDDAHLRHDEIVFGFRVWRENRDRIVGFPGRYHAWAGSSWAYNSNYSCELSMVLTGAAFYHRIYSYLYTYEMSSLIRDKVDELMNCEDIAMNFLVSHITGRPPVKVTSRWTFRCPGCPVTLSEDDSHFQERHECINYFSRIYGYTPLLYTQFRADSILFKTRIPHDKQKCFKYI